MISIHYQKLNLKNKKRFVYDYLSSDTTSEKIEDRINLTKQRMKELKQAIKCIEAKKINLNYRYVIRWDTYEILLKLYNKIKNDKNMRNNFLSKLQEIIISPDSIRELPYTIDVRSPNYYDSSSLAFYFLIRNDKIDNCIEAIKISQEKRPSKLIDFLIKDIIDFIYFEPYLFDFESLNKLKQIIESSTFQGDTENLNNLITQLNFLQLDRELKGIEEQIQDDKREVIQKIKKFGFPDELEKCLNQVDEALKLPDLGAVNSGMINGIREFIRQLFIHIAKRISSITNENILHEKDRSKITDIRLYVKDKLSLSDREDELFDAYVNMLHVQGGHKMHTDRKYLILLYNIGIELSYFLLSELEKFESQHLSE